MLGRSLGRVLIAARFEVRFWEQTGRTFGHFERITSSSSSSSGTKPLPPHVGHCRSSSVPFSTTPSPLQSGQVFMCAPHKNTTAGRMRVASANAYGSANSPSPRLLRNVILSGHSGDTSHVVLERAGDLDSDRWDSTSFSVVEGGKGGHTCCPVTALICCCHERPSATIRSNAPTAQF